MAFSKDTSRRRQTVDQALAEQGSQPQQLPAELLDELVPTSNVGELLPPLPAHGHQRQTPEQVIENEAPKEKRLEAAVMLLSCSIGVFGRNSCTRAGQPRAPRKACIFPACLDIYFFLQALFCFRMLM